MFDHSFFPVLVLQKKQQKTKKTKYVVSENCKYLSLSLRNFIFAFQVVLMSATVDSSLFSNYFSILINGKKEGAPVISVEGKMYDVMEYYNDDVLSFAEVTKIIFAQKTHLQKRFN